MEKRTIVLNDTEFVLGNKYTDTILNITGIAIAGAQYLTGCDQILLAFTDKGGSANNHWVDVTRIGKVEVTKKRGGPAPMIPSRHP